MNRRGFLGLLGKAAIGTYVAYSFPSILVPKNIISLEEVATDHLSQLNAITLKEIYPELIEDVWFTESPFFARMKAGVPTYEQLEQQFTKAMLDKTNPNYYLNV